MLYELLVKNKKLLLNKTNKLSELRSGKPPNSRILKKGLALLFDEIVAALKRHSSASSSYEPSLEEILPSTAANRGVEFLRLGYTIPQLIYSYGGLCESVMGLAHSEKYPISQREFLVFNMCIDKAIAAATEAFCARESSQRDKAEELRLGYLAHELRNSLAVVSMSWQILQAGTVSLDGPTSQVLENALARLHNLIDRSLLEVRLHNPSEIELTRFFVIDAVSEAEIGVRKSAIEKKIVLQLDIDPRLQVNADRHLIVAAITNLMQNAIKFSAKNAEVFVRYYKESDSAILEVEDECGGLPAKFENEIFKPLAQCGSDRTGIGVGLAVSRQSFERCKGSLAVINLPGKGCIFKASLPAAA